MGDINAFILRYNYLPLVLAAVIGLVRYRHLGLPQRRLLLLTLESGGMEATARMVVHYQQSNLFLAPLDTALEFTLPALIYRLVLRPSWLRRLIPCLVGAFLLGTALTYLPRPAQPEFSPWQHTLEAGLILSFVGRYLYREITQPVISDRLEKDPMFWVSAGALLYFSGSLLFFLSSNYVLHLSPALSLQVWTVHALFYSFLNLLYAVALACPPRRPRARITQS